MWTTLNFESRSETKKRGRDICKGILDIDCERDWSASLGATLGDGQKIKKTIFLVSGIFPGKVDSVISLGFECTINPQNLIKIVWAIFDKIKIFNFFLMWTTLNFRDRRKTKKGSRYLQEDSRYRILTRSVDRRRSDRHTHTHFSKTHFRLWEWCRIKNHKKSK